MADAKWRTPVVASTARSLPRQSPNRAAQTSFAREDRPKRAALLNFERRILRQLACDKGRTICCHRDREDKRDMSRRRLHGARQAGPRSSEAKRRRSFFKHRPPESDRILRGAEGSCVVRNHLFRWSPQGRNAGPISDQMFAYHPHCGRPQRRQCCRSVLRNDNTNIPILIRTLKLTHAATARLRR